MLRQLQIFGLAVLLLAGSVVFATQSTPPEQSGWKPQFNQCPHDTVVVVKMWPRGEAYVQAVNPNSGKTSDRIRYHLVSGEGSVDSLWGVWRIRTSGLPVGYVGHVEIAASLGKRSTSGSDNCHFVFRVERGNWPPSVLPTGLSCQTPYGFTVDPLVRKYCATFTYDFDVCDRNGDPCLFELVAGPGSIDTVTGVWSWNGATLADVDDSIIVQVRAKDIYQAYSQPVSLRVHVTDAAPEILSYEGCPVNGGRVATHIVRTIQFPAIDDCGVIYWLVPDDNDTATTTSIDNTGMLRFSASAPGNYTVNVVASDGLLADTCAVVFTVTDRSDISVSIERTGLTLQGQFEYVDVTLDGATSQLGGFNLLISYDYAALSLQEVLKGTIYTECKWEYFTYRFGADGNCTGGCPSGLVRVVGVAETNNGAFHPTCFGNPGQTLVTLKFLVSDDRDLECTWIPIRFFWLACNDNALTNPRGDWLLVANRVFGLPGDSVPMDPPADFPSYAGVPVGFCMNTFPDRPTPIRDIDFYDGGVDIVCADSIDARGDINLNGISCEIADFVLFSRYFIYGPEIFTVNRDGQIAATDVNSDNLTLRVEDLVCLGRTVATGSTICGPNSMNPATFALSNGVVTVATSDTLGAIFLKFEGNVSPRLLITDMTMMYNYNGTFTSVLVMPPIEYLDTTDVIHAGPILSVGSTAIMEASTATYLGGKIVSHVDIPSDASFPDGSNLPAAFALHQNYPNPFNAGTVISFDLPRASDVALDVFNVLGQVVFAYQEKYSAGTHHIAWNGTDANGGTVASGLYYYRITAGEFTTTRKMLLLK